MEINILLTPEFQTACDILYLKPIEVLQAFTENVSLAHYCSTDEFLAEKSKGNKDPGDTKLEIPIYLKGDLRLMATAFLISFNSCSNERLLPAKKIQKKYLRDLSVLISRLELEPMFELRYFKFLAFYYNWHRELINNISKNDAIIDVKSRKTKLTL